jgi:hypothetical protein
MQNANMFNNPLVLGRFASDPAGGQPGAIYFNTTDSTFHVYLVSSWVSLTTGGSAVTTVSVASANGFAGTSSGGTTPSLTLSTTVTGILKGNGTAISAATAGTDYVIPSGNITGTAANITATSNGTLTTLSALSLPYSQITGAPAAITSLTGDGTASGPGTAAFTLATVNSNVGSFGDASHVATFTVNAKGLITAAGNTAIAISGSQVSGGTLGAVNGSAITNLSAANISGVLPVGVTGGSGLSIATSQLTGQVTLSQLPSIGADTVLGSIAGGTPVALSTTQLTTLINNFSATLSGAAPASGGGSVNFLRADGTWAMPAGTGTVTSVALADGSTTPIYTISGSPVTGSGTLDFTLNTQAANSVFAGPATGSAAQPTFRSLVAADIPSLSSVYLSLAGGTMSGAIAMGSNKITGLASGTTTGDALQWGQIGVANGIAGLDGGGKVPLSQLPANLFEYQGRWNPNTNTPTLVDGTGTSGFVYWVSAADTGTVSGLTDPSMVNFQIGDLVMYNGTQWQLTTPAAGVQSVNGAQGAVTVNAISQLTGDGTAGPASGSQSQVFTLATVNTNVGTFASVTVNGKGLVTAAANLSGDATTSGSVLTLATVNSNVGTFAIATVTVNAKGLVTAASAATTTGTGSTVVLNASPTFTGTITAAAANFSGAIGANGGITSTGALTVNANSGGSAINLESTSVTRGANTTSVVTETYTDSLTLTDATTTSLGSFTSSTVAGWQIDYVIENGASPSLTRTGVIKVTCSSDGSNPSLIDDFAESGDCGIIWSATNSSGTITVTATATSQGSNRTMRYDLKAFRR